MTRANHRSEALTAQLSVEAKAAMRGANFNDRGGVLKSPANKISDCLIALELRRFLKDELVRVNKV